MTAAGDHPLPWETVAEINALDGEARTLRIGELVEELERRRLFDRQARYLIRLMGLVATTAMIDRARSCLFEALIVILERERAEPGTFAHSYGGMTMAMLGEARNKLTHEIGEDNYSGMGGAHQLHRKSMAVRRAANTLSGQLGRAVTPQEVADALNEQAKTRRDAARQGAVYDVQDVLGVHIGEISDAPSTAVRWTPAEFADTSLLHPMELTSFVCAVAERCAAAAPDLARFASCWLGADLPYADWYERTPKELRALLGLSYPRIAVLQEQVRDVARQVASEWSSSPPPGPRAV